MLVTVRRLGLREGRKRNVPRQPRDFVWLSGGGGDEGDLVTLPSKTPLTHLQ